MCARGSASAAPQPRKERRATRRGFPAQRAVGVVRRRRRAAAVGDGTGRRVRGGGPAREQPARGLSWAIMRRHLAGRMLANQFGRPLQPGEYSLTGPGLRPRTDGGQSFPKWEGAWAAPWFPGNCCVPARALSTCRASQPAGPALTRAWAVHQRVLYVGRHPRSDMQSFPAAMPGQRLREAAGDLSRARRPALMVAQASDFSRSIRIRRAGLRSQRAL